MIQPEKRYLFSEITELTNVPTRVLRAHTERLRERLRNATIIHRKGLHRGTHQRIHQIAHLKFVHRLCQR